MVSASGLSRQVKISENIIGGDSHWSLTSGCQEGSLCSSFSVH